MKASFGLVKFRARLYSNPEVPKNPSLHFFLKLCTFSVNIYIYFYILGLEEYTDIM